MANHQPSRREILGGFVGAELADGLATAQAHDKPADSLARRGC
jgi:hypothetical protein